MGKKKQRLPEPVEHWNKKPWIELRNGVVLPNPLGQFFPMAFPLCAEGRSMVKLKKLDLFSAAVLARFTQRVLDQFPACWTWAA
jgi:hypothetical protein